MKITVEIDDELMRRAMKSAGITTKRETVEKALKLLLQLEGQKSIRRLRGKISWEGDLDAMRRD